MILQGASAGEPAAVRELFAAVYDDLRVRARAYLASERPDHTLQPTALVHEAYMRLIDQNRVVWQNRAHFLAVAGQAMRRILVDHARSRGCSKRSGGKVHLQLDDELVLGDEAAGSEGQFEIQDSRSLVKVVEDREKCILRFFSAVKELNIIDDQHVHHLVKMNEVVDSIVPSMILELVDELFGAHI